MSIETKPEASTFSLRTPYLSAGRTTTFVSRTDLMSVAVKVYAEGGENALHTHLNEDHTFIVLQGEATFYDENNTERVVKQWEGIALPRGAYYWFKSTGEENLVLARFGARDANAPKGDSRVDIEGDPLPAESLENKHVVGVPVPGKFFGE